MKRINPSKELEQNLLEEDKVHFSKVKHDKIIDVLIDTHLFSNKCIDEPNQKKKIIK